MINDTIREKINFFYNEGTLVHIKTDSKFYNGLILNLNDKFLTLEDEKLGKIIIYFIEIISIETRLPRRFE